MTIEEIQTAITNLSKEDQGKIFEGKNTKLNAKDKLITKLTSELDVYKVKETEDIHNKLVEETFNDIGTINKDYNDTVKTLAGITPEDTSKSITDKINKIATQDRYKAFFHEKQTVANTLNYNQPNPTDNQKPETPSPTIYA